MTIITITVYANSATEAQNRNAPNDEQSSNNNRKTTRNPYVDIFVAIITVPTLILLALLLDANIQNSISSPADDTRSSFIVLILGFGFLLLSLLICGCIVHKLGMCRWNRRDYAEEVTAAQQRSNSEFMDFINVIDSPPSYDTVTQDPYKYDSPRFASITKPPTYEIACTSNCCSKECPTGNSVPMAQHI